MRREEYIRYFLFTLLALMGFLPVVSADDDQPQDGPFAVVELFSSQGCSVCPEAYPIVSKLMDVAQEDNQSVYFLDFHVDYFNDKGWQDTYSSSEFSHREYRYDHVLNSSTYTPQMVVNGSDIFVGSNQDRVQEALDRELAKSSSITLDASLTKQDSQAIVKYSSKGFTDGDEIHFALVERGLTTDVTAGENAGSTLHQDNVVREFQTMVLTQNEAQVTIPLDKISDTSYASVIVYVQDPQTMLIKDAKQLDVGS